MNDKEKYMALMRSYWDGETTPEQERCLSAYVAGVDDPDFDELRGVLGYLSIGRSLKMRVTRRAKRFIPIAAIAASLAAVVVLGTSLERGDNKPKEELCVRYAYGEKTEDDPKIMESVQASLAEFFSGYSPAETNLFELFQR